MEQQFDPTYLRAGVVERAAAIGICAAGIGTGILIAAWGISLLWRYTPPEIAVRVANPELSVKQEEPFKVAQDKPFVLAQPDPLQVDPAQLSIKVDQVPYPFVGGSDTSAKTASGDVIRREVTVFSEVEHGTGSVTTGWNYKDGSGGVPIRQYCYYTAPDGSGASKKIDIALDRSRLFSTAAPLVPNLEGALAKCQWWRN